MLLNQVLFPIIALICLLPSISAGMALMFGIAFSLILGNPYSKFTSKVTHRLLQMSIIGLGAGMDLRVIGQVGMSGIGYTAVGILFAMSLGIFLGKVLKTESDTSLLISVGTAICGGSAIAAVASTIKAKSDEVSLALATVFFLNAMALFIFPPIGHHFNLTETQFGLWSALAIHDTSSVVGASLQYGAHAVQVGTTVKLTRALWIIPVSLVIGLFWKRNSKSSPKVPWFIFGFILAAALVTWIPAVQPIGNGISWVAKRSLVLTLFFIGSGISRGTLQNLGFKPFVQGVFLWFLVAIATLSSILGGWIA